MVLYNRFYFTFNILDRAGYLYPKLLCNPLENSILEDLRKDEITSVGISERFADSHYIHHLQLKAIWESFHRKEHKLQNMRLRNFESNRKSARKSKDGGWVGWLALGGSV